MADTELVGISGADLVAFKAALGAIFYMTPISSQTVSSPVDHIDLTLPTGYSSFLCTMAGVGVDGAPGNLPRVLYWNTKREQSRPNRHGEL
jgi:hypothetical protein